MWILAVITLLSLLVGIFDWAAQPIAKVLGKPIEGVKSMARTIAAVGIGAIVTVAAIASIAAAPVLGVVLLVVGIGTMVYALWPLISPSNPIE